MANEARIRRKLQRIRDHRRRVEVENATSVTKIGNKNAIFTMRRKEDEK